MKTDNRGHRTGQRDEGCSGLGHGPAHFIRRLQWSLNPKNTLSSGRITLGDLRAGRWLLSESETLILAIMVTNTVL